MGRVTSKMEDELLQNFRSFFKYVCIESWGFTCVNKTLAWNSNVLQ